MNQEIRDLYNQYVHKRIDRREFLKKISVLAGGALAVNTLLPLLERNYAAAAIVSKDDPRLYTENVTYSGATGEVRAYLARPK